MWRWASNSSMEFTVLLISKDEEWRKSITAGLIEREFHVTLCHDPGCYPENTPDTILLDISDCDKRIKELVLDMIEIHPLSEWILFFGETGLWINIDAVSKRACDIISKTTNMESIALSVLTACTRKRNAEMRLRSLNSEDS